MSEQNVEVVRERYEQFASGDFSRLTDVADDFEVIPSRENPDAGSYRGEPGKRWLETWVESFDGLTIEATEIVDAGDEIFLAIVQARSPSRKPDRGRGALVAGADGSRRGLLQAADVSRTR